MAVVDATPIASSAVQRAACAGARRSERSASIHSRPSRPILTPPRLYRLYHGKIQLNHDTCNCDIVAHVAGASEARWLLLIHQIPPKPAYLRVKAVVKVATMKPQEKAPSR